jgi:hypothetical protein
MSSLETSRCSSLRYVVTDGLTSADLAKFYIFTLNFKFSYKQTPDDVRLDRNM